MDTVEAILSRHSVRDFEPRAVPKEIIMKILEVATHSPSGGNGQPWEVFVATGETVEQIRKTYQERFQSGIPGPGGPPNSPSYMQERMNIIRKERLQLMGLDPSDPVSGKIFMEYASRLYGTKVLAVVCMDKALVSNSFYLDIGLFVQTVCVAAYGYGIDSLVAGSFLFHQDVLRQQLEIPENLNIVVGIGLGYSNQDNIINTYRSPRRPIQEVVRYRC